jgi:hypothetical protein
MSHEATNWAIKQRGLKPAAKIVLWHLCDRYHPDNGCFPSLDTLADDCEMSRRSVQDQIAALEAAGLLRIEKMPRQRGQMPRNRYVLAFEQDGASLGQNLPMAKSALGKKSPPPLANSRDHLGQNLPTNPVKGTSKRTSNNPREAQEVSDALCQVLSPEVAADFIAHRKAKRSALTIKAAQLIAKKLAGHPSPDAVVENSIANGWTGVFPDSTTGPPGASKQPDIAAIMATL